MKEHLDLTPEQEECLETVAEAIDLIIEKETGTLMNLINLTNSVLDIQMVDGQLRSELNLRVEELELLAIKIPAECMILQGKINKIMAEGVASTLLLEARLAAASSSLAGAKMTVDEKKKASELQVFSEKINDISSKNIIKGLQDTINRADKVYEGIKKVMDYRAKEGFFERKSQIFCA